MTISVIICTRNRPQSLVETVRSILAADREGDDEVEIIVADNGSETAPFLPQDMETGVSVRLIREKRLGKSVAANAAAASARGQVLLFTDDDIRVPHDWLSGMSQPILDDTYDVISAPVILPKSRVRSWMTAEHRKWLGCNGNRERAPCSVLGGNMAASKRAFEAMEGFEKHLGPGGVGHEDVMFGLRAMAEGYRVGLLTDPAVEHHFSEEKVTRASFIDAMRRGGQFGAYIAYHWHSEHWRHPRLRFVAAALELNWARIKRWRQWRKHPALPEWEIPLLMRYFARKHYLLERKRPRRYAASGEMNADARSEQER